MHLEEEFQQAIDTGNITLIKDIIARHGSKIFQDYITWDNPRRESPIHRAINQNQPDVCLFLLQQKKASSLLKHKDFRGETPLHRCGWCGREEIASELLKLGAKVNETNALGLTPLHLAAERGKLGIVELLIQNKADVNAKSHQGNTPLHRASTGEHKDLVLALIKAGASPDILNRKGTRAGGKYTTQELLKQAESRTVIRTSSKALNGTKENEPLRYDVEVARLPDMDTRFYEIHPSRVVYGKKLGEGGFGTVYEGTVSAQPVALKQLSSTHARIHENFRKELDVMCKLRHPNIVLLLGAVIQSDQLCLVMEICQGGPLTSLLKNRKLKVPEVIRVATDIAQAMNWLHTRNPPILHLDLKPANILLSDLDSLHVKVSDFGLARPSNSDSRAIVGTRRFMAPEMMRKQPVNEAADVYSFGILLWQIYTRKKPFSGFKTLKTPQEKTDFAEAVWGGYRPPISLSMPPLLAHLMTSCWNTEPEKRPNFTQVLKWLDQILLHNVFISSRAQVFWDSATVNNPNRYLVTFSKIESEWRARLKQGEHSDEDVKDAFDCIKNFLCPSTSKSVTITDFNNFCNSFGKFDENVTLWRFNRLINLQWTTYSEQGIDSSDTYPVYFPTADRPKAIALLVNRPVGTFLVRNSSNKGTIIAFVISHVTSATEILHTPVCYHNARDVYTVGDITSKENQDISSFITSPPVMESLGLRFATHISTQFSYVNTP